MTDRPIIFSAPMVRALLDGRKTQTRRVLKPQPSEGNIVINDSVMGPRALLARAKYKTGDRLYVREAFWSCPTALTESGWDVDTYRVDDNGPAHGRTPRPSIHMPRWASRLTLTVTDVRVQRLQAISAADTIAEGVQCDTCKAMAASACHGRGCFASTSAFKSLWNSLHGADAWDANPWVVALTFTVQRGNIDAA